VAVEDRRQEQHGWRSTYTAGCRCERCRDSNAAYMREVRAGRRGSHDRRLPGFRLETSQLADNPTGPT
jgi:hypothetical protein